jgi:hypothetical protein
MVEETKTCIECNGVISPIVIMHTTYHINVSGSAQELQYQQPDDNRSFWSGKFPTAGPVRAFLCIAQRFISQVAR